MFGSPLFADGKLYIAENTGRVYIFKPTPEGVEQLSMVRLNGEEIFGSPIASARQFISQRQLPCIALATKTLHLQRTQFQRASVKRMSLMIKP
jgi:hypothetical protein